MQDKLSRILEDKGREVHSVSPEATVLEAVRKMNEHRIGAVLVTEEDRPVGIFTERDVLQRVVAAQRDPEKTRVSDVMSQDLACVHPETTVQEAMAVVTENRCRHLPVVEEDRVVGMVSIGDLTHWMVKDQHVRIRDLVDYITGKYPG